jgi:hypothetical protein
MVRPNEPLSQAIEHPAGPKAPTKAGLAHEAHEWIPDERVPKDTRALDVRVHEFAVVLIAHSFSPPKSGRRLADKQTAQGAA